MTKTIEQLQAELDAANSSVTKLEGLNATLKQENKDFSTKYAAAKTEAENAREEAENATTDEVTRLKNQLNKLTKDLETANGKTAGAHKALQTYKAETEIGKMLVAHKVQPDDAPMVTAYIKSLMSLDDEGAISFNGSTAEDFGKTYFGGAGKRYTSAPDTSGAGSTGFDGTKAPRMTADNWNWTEFAKIQAESPQEAAAIAKAAGKEV